MKVFDKGGLFADKQEKDENVGCNTMADPRFKDFDYIDEESAEIELCLSEILTKVYKKQVLLLNTDLPLYFNGHPKWPMNHD